jgi:hypothetical protein
MSEQQVGELSEVAGDLPREGQVGKRGLLEEGVAAGFGYRTFRLGLRGGNRRCIKHPSLRGEIDPAYSFTDQSLINITHLSIAPARPQPDSAPGRHKASWASPALGEQASLGNEGLGEKLPFQTFAKRTQ